MPLLGLLLPLLRGLRILGGLRFGSNRTRLLICLAVAFGLGIAHGGSLGVACGYGLALTVALRIVFTVSRHVPGRHRG